MSLRFTVSQSVAHLLAGCSLPVRSRVLRELSLVLSGASFRRRPPHRSGPEVGVLRLPSGFQVSYRLDPLQGSVEMLELGGLSASPPR